MSELVRKAMHMPTDKSNAGIGCTDALCPVDALRNACLVIVIENRKSVLKVWKIYGVKSK